MIKLAKGNVKNYFKSIQNYGILKIYRTYFVHCGLMLTVLVINYILIDIVLHGNFARLGWSYERLKCLQFPLNCKCEIELYVSGSLTEKTFWCAIFVNNVNGPFTTLLWYALTGMLIIVTLDTLMWIALYFFPSKTMFVILKTFNLNSDSKRKLVKFSLVLKPEVTFFLIQILKNTPINKRIALVRQIEATFPAENGPTNS